MKQSLQHRPCPCSNRARGGLGLALVTTLCTAAAACTLLIVPIRGSLGLAQPYSSLSSDGAPQEPPPDRSIWEQFSNGAAALFHKEAELAHEARKRAAEKLGASAWCQAGCRGKGMKIAILDSGFKGYAAALGKRSLRLSWRSRSARTASSKRRRVSTASSAPR